VLQGRTERMGRLRFFLWWIGGTAATAVVWAIGVPAISALFGSYVEFPAHWLIILMILAWLYVYLGRVVPARLRDAGWRPLLSVVFLIPIAGWVMLIVLLIVPGKNPDSGLGDATQPSLQTPK
jgi:uncharacterized membrane protein YhaH (DUF805 family)